MFGRLPTCPYCHRSRTGPWIHLSRSRDRLEFLRVTEVLKSTFGLELVETYGGVDGKVPIWNSSRPFQRDAMREEAAHQQQTGLDICQRPVLFRVVDSDDETIEAIARHFEARFHGWRWRMIELRRWIAGYFGAR